MLYSYGVSSEKKDRNLKSGLYIIAAAILVTTVGCRSAEAEKKEVYPVISRPEGKNADALRKRAELFTAAMARSFRTGDFSSWRAALEKESPPGRPLVVDEKKFKQMCSRLKKDWGTLKSCTYLGELDQTLLRDFLWKCTFEFRNSSGELCHIEELFVVRCTVLRGKAMFTNFGFRFFNGPEYRKRVIEHKKAEERRK